jgi:hypothetical protein
MMKRPYEQKQKPVQTGAAPWMRLLAFWFDVTLVAAPIKLVLFLLDAERYQGFTLSLYGVAPSLLVIVTSLPLMALTTSRWGTTAGKRLLGCSVRPEIRLSAPPGESRERTIKFTRAYKRTIVSYTVGAGMAVLPEVTALSLFFCYRGLKYRGKTFWDAIYKTEVEHTPIRPVQAAAFAIGLLLLRLTDTIPLAFTVYAPYLREIWDAYQAQSQSLYAAVRIIFS